MSYVRTSREQAEKIAESAKLTGCRAMHFVKENKDKIGAITENQQLILFNKIYQEPEIIIICGLVVFLMLNVEMILTAQ